MAPNEIRDAIKTVERQLPDDLTWLDAFRYHKDATLELLAISGRVDVNDLLNSADRLRLADILVIYQTSSKEENTMTNEAADISMFSDENRPYLLAAQKHRAKLQKSDTESIFDIALRLKEMIEKKRADDAAQRRPEAAMFDASAHRAGWRTADACRALTRAIERFWGEPDCPVRFAKPPGMVKD